MVVFFLKEYVRRWFFWYGRGESWAFFKNFSLPGRGFSATWKRIFRYLEEDFPIPGRIISDTWKRMFLYLDENFPLPGRGYYSTWKRMFLYLERMFIYMKEDVSLSYLEKYVPYLEEHVSLCFLYLKKDVSLPGSGYSSTMDVMFPSWRGYFSTWNRLFPHPWVSYKQQESGTEFRLPPIEVCFQSVYPCERYI
jgi:hypothetical protein